MTFATGKVWEGQRRGTVDGLGAIKSLLSVEEDCRGVAWQRPAQVLVMAFASCLWTKGLARLVVAMVSSVTTASEGSLRMAMWRSHLAASWTAKD